MKKNSNKKGMGAVIALSVAILLTVVVITIAIASMIKENGGLKKNEDTSLYSRSDVTNPTKVDNSPFDLDANQNEETNLSDAASNGNDSFVDVEAGDKQTQATTKVNSYNPVEEYEKLTKNGNNQLSDHHNNKYIKLRQKISFQEHI